MLTSLYISPLESCNLACKFCYTKKTPAILTNRQILNFIKKYKRYLLDSYFLILNSVTLCGGEVFALKHFPKLINNLLKLGIFTTIITNGTIDKLDQIKDTKNCQLLVSLDGPEKIHDKNRGQGNFAKSINFINHALSLGFPTEIFFLITKDSYPHKDSFDVLGLPKTYLTDRLGSLTSAEILDIKQNYPTFPSKNFGCSQISLQSDGLIYGCCESPTPIGKLSHPIKKIVTNFLDSLTTCRKCVLFKNENEANNFSARSERNPAWPGSPKVARTVKIRLPICKGCCHPKYNCGYSQELHLPNCQSVIKSFHINS
jgi:organic radical activating enzyme